MLIQLILLFIFISIVIFTSKENYSSSDKIKYWLIGIILILIAGLRPEDATKDYQNYLNAYNVINGFSDTRFEPSFKLIVFFVKEIFSNPTFLFLIFAVLGVSLKLLALKELTKFCFLSLLIYVCYYYFLHELTQIRAGVASGILLLSIKPLRERNPFKYFSLVFIATTFHYSAIVIFPLWFMNPNSFNRTLFASLIPISLILNVNGIFLTSLIKYIPIQQIQLLFEMRSSQMAQGIIGDKVNVFNTFFLFRVVVFYFLLYRTSVLRNRNKYFNSLMQIEGISLIAFIMLSDFAVVSFRISELLGIVEIVLFAEISRSFKPMIMSNIIGLIIALSLLYLSLFHIELIIN